MIDFSLGEELEALKARVREFVDKEVIPLESRVARDHRQLEHVRSALQAKAKEWGIFLPHLPKELGGMGLSWRATAVVLEEAGRSLLGPQALNAAAPDEGNMHLLWHVASEEQKRRYLFPLARGEIRSAFAMTEPMGAGADPTLLRTRAERRNGKWILNGRKWFSTGAEGAAFFIVLALAPEGPTMFLVDASNPGIRLLRSIPTMDHMMPGGHGDLVLENCEVDDGAVLGEVGKGFEYAQLRLDPARLTHCMRWLGVAVRAMELTNKYLRERESFGKKLGEHQGVQWMIADSYIEIHAARLMIWHAAWKLDRGERVRHEASMTKVFVAETVNRVIDRALQLTGGLGVSEDIPLSIFFREARPFRIYDGPSEVHRTSIGKRVYYRELRP